MDRRGLRRWFRPRTCCSRQLIKHRLMKTRIFAAFFQRCEEWGSWPETIQYWGRGFSSTDTEGYAEGIAVFVSKLIHESNLELELVKKLLDGIILPRTRYASRKYSYGMLLGKVWTFRGRTYRWHSSLLLLLFVYLSRLSDSMKQWPRQTTVFRFSITMMFLSSTGRSWSNSISWILIYLQLRIIT